MFAHPSEYYIIPKNIFPNFTIIVVQRLNGVWACILQTQLSTVVAS